jgi:glycosyltransferase involved in cell wall biosynthesis
MQSKEDLRLKVGGKIVFVHLNNNYSGSPRVLQTVINALQERPSVLITSATEGFLTDVKIQKLTFTFKLSRYKILTLLFYIYSQVFIFLKVLIVCKKKDLLYVNTTIPISAGLAGRLKNAIVLFHLHEDVNSLNIVHKSLAKLRNYISDIEIFVSNYLYKTSYVEGKNSFLLYNVLPETFIEAALKVKVQHKQNSIFNILMISSLKSYKGVYEFLKISEKLNNIPDINFTLVVDEDLNTINHFFSNTNLPKNLFIHKRTSSTIEFYRNSSLLLNLSRPDQWVETFGLTILEAMTVGLPCIVPPIGGPIELIEDGINGFRVSCYDLDKLQNVIMLLYGDSNLFMKISENNRSKAIKFNFHDFKNKLNGIIEFAYNKL